MFNLTGFLPHWGKVCLLIAVLTACGDTSGSTDVNLLLGNPSNATADPSNKDNYLLVKPQYTLSYNDSLGVPNWASWQLTQAQITQQVKRCKSEGGQDNFQPDPDLPEGFRRIKPSDYSRSGYDRGHVVPSGDRTDNREDNCATFLMTNMVPQRPNLNRKVWASFEDYARELVQSGKELYVIAGPGKTQKMIQGKVMVPASTWKVLVVLDRPGSGLAGVDRVIAVNMPNRDTVSEDWQDYRVSVDEIEALTGFDLLSALPKDVQDRLER